MSGGGAARPLVFAAMRDKDIAGMFAALLPAVGHLVVTRASNARSAEPDVLAGHARAVAPGLPITIEPVVADALDAPGAIRRDRRRGIDLPARRRDQADRWDVIRFEHTAAADRMLNLFRFLFCTLIHRVRAYSVRAGADSAPPPAQRHQ